MRLQNTKFLHKDINQMAESISSFLNKSVLIENKNFELLAYSSPDDAHFDLTQQKTILSKKCPMFIIEQLEKEGIVQQLEMKDAPIRVKPIEDVGFYQRVVISVKHNQETVGYIWVHESNTLLKEEELHFLSEISPLVGIVIYEQYAKNGQSYNGDHQLLWKLINHDYINEQQIRREAGLGSLWLPDRFVVMVISITDFTYESLLEEIKMLIDNIQTINTSSYLEKSKVVVVIGGNSPDKDARQLIQLLKEKGETLLIGVGDEYTQLRDMRKSFLQALEVIETANFANQTSTIPYEYSKLGMYRYLLTLFKKNSSEGFINYDLLKILQKDDENNSQLLKTLEVYLANNCKLKKTATLLFIHPNTLNYRIKQIADSTGINFDDFNMNSHLYTELLLLNNIHEYKQRYREAIQKYI